MPGLSGWTSRAIAITDLQLDPRNPRLELADSSSQQEVIEALIKHEDVVDLARRIQSFGGLYPNERVIAVYEDGQFVVLEGNRRTCAAKLLIEPSNAPQEYQQIFEGLTSKPLMQQIETLDVEVAPSRSDAQPLIAHIHAFAARKQWTPLAKMRFANQLVAEHGSL